MKALRNFKHNGVYYEAGQNLDHMELVEPGQITDLLNQITVGRTNVSTAVHDSDLALIHHKMTQAEHDSLVDAGVITDNDSEPLPQPIDDLELFNIRVQRGDDRAEKQRKSEQAATRADNVADVVNPPQPAPSNVEKGTAADAEAAIAKSNAAAAAAPAAAPAQPADAAPAAAPAEQGAAQ